MDYSFQDFKDEGIRGSYITTQNALKVLHSYIERFDSDDLDAMGQEINKIGRDIIKIYPNMVIVRKNTTVVVYYLKRLVKSGKNLDEVKKLSILKLNELINESESKMKKIGENGSKLIMNQFNILTISYSSQLKSIFMAAHKQNRKFTVYCLESRPSYEGHRFAEELAEIGIRTHILTDASMGQYIPKMNMVLTGADRVYESGFVSKTGSLPVAIVADSFQIPLYIAFETDKILMDHEQAVRFYPEKTEEVYSGKHKNIEVSNFYFDSVPFDYVLKVVCEEGIFSLKEFKDWYIED